MTYLTSNLRYLRKNNNYSQDELAAKLFVTHQTISNHETGKSEPSLDMIEKYANFYRISFQDIVHTDLTKTRKSTRIIFRSVLFDTKVKIFIILDGSQGTYPYTKSSDVKSFMKKLAIEAKKHRLHIESLPV